MDLNRLAIFVAVAEAKSFTAAARQLHIAKSTASERVRALEAELGVQLLSRTTRRLSLTEAGEALYERGRDIIGAAADAEQALSTLRSSPVGTLRISAPTALGRRFFGPIIATLLQTHPGLRLELDLSDQDADLVGDRYDLAVRIGALSASSLVARRVGISRRLVVAAPSYLALFGRPETPASLRDHECLRFAYQRQPDTWRFDRADGTDGTDGALEVKIAGRLLCNDGDVLAATAAAGLGLAWLPDIIANPFIQDGRLETVLTDYCRSEAPVQLVYPARRHRLQKVQLFAEAFELAFSG